MTRHKKNLIHNETYRVNKQEFLVIGRATIKSQS